MSDDKIRVPRSSVVSEKGQKLVYVDDGGTLRNTVKSKVEIVEDGAVTESAQTGEVNMPVAESTVSEPAGPLTDGAPVEVPPSSDTPIAAEPAAAPEAAAQPKPSRKREKIMATAQTASSKKSTPPKTKTAAKKAPAKRANGHPKTETTGVRTIAGKVVDLSGYEKTKAPGGGTSWHNGDAVAEKLAGKTLDDAYAAAAKTLKVEEKELRKQYGHLNVGMQRMTLGNRMRKVLIPKAARTN